MQKLSGRSKHVRTAEAEENVLNLVAEDPSTSSRLIATQLGISKSTVNRVTREQQLHPYHLQPVQELLPPDYAARVHFCEIIRHKRPEHYPGKWIGRGADAPIQWPPRSPDLTPCDFFLWGGHS
nr:unnamed protein product [Callosobruchus analis]